MFGPFIRPLQPSLVSLPPPRQPHLKQAVGSANKEPYPPQTEDEPECPVMMLW